jgi:hypothetical protein
VIGYKVWVGILTAMGYKIVAMGYKIVVGIIR